MPHDVTLIGTLNADLIIHGTVPADLETLTGWSSAADISLKAGGSVGYAALAFTQMGLSVCVSSCLADDPFSDSVDHALRDSGVDLSLVQRVSGAQGALAVYMLLFGGRKRPLVYRMPTHPFWQTDFSPAEADHLLDTRVLHLGGYLHHEASWHGAAVDLFREARARGVITALDPQFPVNDLPSPWLPALADILPHVDLLFCDEGEALNLTAAPDLAAAAQILLAAGARTVIVKRGSRGSLVYAGNTVHTQAAVMIGDLEDTIGAGDVYDAGYLYGVLQGWDVPRAARFASVAAGFSATSVGGAIPELPALLAVIARFA